MRHQAQVVFHQHAAGSLVPLLQAGEAFLLFRRGERAGKGACPGDVQDEKYEPGKCAGQKSGHHYVLPP